MTVERYHVDPDGNCLGYFDTVGHYFDPAGQYHGSLSQDGSFFDQYGTVCGRVDAQRRVWDKQGSYRGYLVDAKGHDRPELPRARVPVRQSSPCPAARV